MTDILRAARIPAFLHAGSMLGAVYHQGIASNDDEIDLAFFFRDHAAVVLLWNKVIGPDTLGGVGDSQVTWFQHASEWFGWKDCDFQFMATLRQTEEDRAYTEALGMGYPENDPIQHKEYFESKIGGRCWTQTLPDAERKMFDGSASANREWWRWRRVDQSDTWYCHQHMTALAIELQGLVPKEGRLYSSNMINRHVLNPGGYNASWIYPLRYCQFGRNGSVPILCPNAFYELTMTHYGKDRDKMRDMSLDPSDRGILYNREEVGPETVNVEHPDVFVDGRPTASWVAIADRMEHLDRPETQCRRNCTCRAVNAFNDIVEVLPVGTNARNLPIQRCCPSPGCPQPPYIATRYP